MLTQAELSVRLSELGIARSGRVLTDWRERGLLPPLSQTGFRGGGSKHFWDDGDAVLEQAVAADCLLKNYARRSAALFGLWVSGYPVDAERARRAWIRHLERQKREVEQAAPRFKDRYLGIGRSLWRMLGKRPWLEEFLLGLVESSFDNLERDDEGYRAKISWLLNEAPGAGASRAEVHDLISSMTCAGWDVANKDRSASKRDRSDQFSAAFKKAIDDCIELIHSAIESFSDEGTTGDDTFRFVDAAWEKANLQTTLIVADSIETVRSMTTVELDETRQKLATIRRMIGHCVELTTRPLNRRLAVLVQVAFMTAGGPFVANQIIQFNRSQPEWPLAETISSIHDFVMGVQYVDLHRKNDKYHASQKVRNEWTTTRQELSQLWAALLKNNEN